jgi:hypothetical protein
MNRSEPMTPGVASAYIRGNFELDDRLAIVLINRRTDTVLQRVAAAERIAGPDVQAWLRRLNERGSEVYLSMNALQEGAQGRTKSEIGAIRHVYLDFDEDGTAAVQRLFARPDLPTPSYVLNTSPDKWQVVWRVEGFGKNDVEDLQKGLAKELGADPAATDCTRVLRLPGFYNHKYREPYLVRVEAHSAIAGENYRPENFPDFRKGEVDRGRESDRAPLRLAVVRLSQSERDWAYAKRALARGEPEERVISAIANQRRYDKHNPQYYAELTVRNAAQSLNVEAVQERASTTEPDR